MLKDSAEFQTNIIQAAVIQDLAGVAEDLERYDRWYEECRRNYKDQKGFYKGFRTRFINIVKRDASF